MGGSQAGRGRRGLLSSMGENIRNQSPSKKHESGAEQGCLGWSTWTPAVHKSCQGRVYHAPPCFGFIDGQQVSLGEEAPVYMSLKP